MYIVKGEKVKFWTLQKKKVIFVLIFVGVFFISGFYFGFKQRPIEKVGDIDLSQMYEVWNILNKDFVDSREGESEEITKQDNIWGMTKGLVASFGDPYTAFLVPEENSDLRDEIKGEFGGAGMEIINRDGFLMVISPLPDTPAYRSGIMPKDVIAEINGKDSIYMSSSEAVKLIRGEPGTKVALKIARKGESELLSIEITRDLIQIPVIKTYEKGDVFVIKLFSFTENSTELFGKALVGEFLESGKSKLIIDLRGNPGGHLFAAVYMAGMFLEKGDVILKEEYGGGKKATILEAGEFHTSDKTVGIFSDNLKLGILMDGGSASASEILAGALSDNNAAVLLGTNTFGKGTVQELKNLDNGTALKLTIAKWILPNGSWISHKGIAPDILVEANAEEMAEFREKGSFSEDIDPQLADAILEMAKIETKEQVVKIIEDSRLEKSEEAKEKRDEQVNGILEGE